MKKRLLSALLALVMVLAMLPATAFAAPEDDGEAPQENEEVITEGTEDEGEGKEEPELQAITPRAISPVAGTTVVEYQATNKAGTIVKDQPSGVVTGAPGWYYKEVKDGITTYEKITGNAIIISGKYQGSSSYTAASGTVTTIGSVSIDASGSSLTVDVYSGTPTITGSSKLTTLNVTDSKFYSENKTTKNEVTLPSTWSTTAPVNVNLTSVSLGTSGSISFTGVTNAHTVKLENADVPGGITLSAASVTGKTDAKMTINVNQDNSTNRRTSVLGGIDVTGNSASVNLVDVKANGGTAPAVTLDGTGTTLTIGGSSAIGKVTLKDHLVNPASTTSLSKVTVNGGTVESIETDSATHAGKVQVTVNKGANVTGGINLTDAATDVVIAADVDVNSATVGSTGIKVKGGTVDVAGPSTVTGLEMDGATTFRLTGTGSTISGIDVKNSQVKMTIPNDPGNTLGAVESGLDKYSAGANNTNAIGGGTWTSEVPKTALSTSLVYQLTNKKGPTITYYTEDQLADALVAQEKSSGTLVCRDDIGNTGKGYNLVFMNGATRWGILKIYGQRQIKLPALVNGVTVTRWADSNTSVEAGSKYPTPAVADVTGGTWELNASGGVTNGDITKLTGVTATPNANWPADMGAPKAVLNGTVINLSGTVLRGETSAMTLTFTTDAVEKDAKDNTKEVPVTLSVGVTYYPGSKTLTFTNPGGNALTKGATLEDNFTVLRLSNGTKYTLNGSGLKERAKQITVDTGTTNIEVGVSGISSVYKTIEAQEKIVNLIKGNKAKFDWSSSPAMKEAVNAALASITDSNVDSYITAAQSAAWQKKNGGTYSATVDGPKTDYTEVVLVPYLQVNLTNYVPGTTATATLVPSWRVEVRQPSGSSATEYANIFADSKKFDQPANAYIAKAGTSLGQLTGDIVKIVFQTHGEFMEAVGSQNFYMHQDSTYAYAHNSDGAWRITHAGTGSNGLGTVVFNKVAPLVALREWDEANEKWANSKLYDSLQAAVDDAKEGNRIFVDVNYKGSTTINVTGTARTFTIQSEGNNIVVANASNGLVTQDRIGNVYTIQLTRDDTAVAGTTASISVATGITNGTVTLSTTRARANTSVEVTTTPAAGYLTRNLTATARTADNKNTTVAVTKTADNKYTFTVPAGATSITVTPTFALNTGLPFTDVAADNSYFEAVKYVYNRGMMNGVPAANGTTVFDGYSTITRGQVVTILYRLSDSPSASTYSGFNDVPSNQYYAAPITWAYSNGIVGGYGNGQFGPNDPITREQLAKILRDYSTYRGLNITKTTSLAGYSDAGSVHDWAQAGMQWAVGNGIVTGTTTTTLTPGGNAQRYHAATMLMRYCNSFGL